MQVRSLLVVIVFFGLFVSGCVTTQEQLTQDEIRSLDAVYQVFEAHDMKILPNLCSSREVVAAEQKVKACENKDHEHGGSHAADGEGGHKFVVISKAIPDASGEYTQPVFNLGEQKYCYKSLYTATVEDKFIRVTKTTGSEESASRTKATVEPEILQEIAEQISGKVQGSGVAW